MIKEFDTHVAFKIWMDEERSPLTCVNHAQKVADWKILENASRFRNIIVNACYRSVNKNLISASLGRWFSKTNTFHMLFGEITITLDDVASLLHIPVEGKPIQSLSFDMEQAVQIVCKYLGLSKAEARLEMNDRVGYKLSLFMLVEKFRDVSNY